MRPDPATFDEVAGSRLGHEPAPRAGVVLRAGRLALRWREASILAAAVLLAVYFQATNAVFLSSDNIGNLVDYTATTSIIAAGEAMVLIAGELDLSVGMVYAFAPFIMFFGAEAGLPMWLAVIVALAAAGLIGVFNAAITLLLNVPAFVTTLGTMFLVNGLTLTISGGFPVQPSAGPAFTWMFGGDAWARLGWAMVVALVLQFVLRKTRFGLHTIASGGNLIGSAEVGVKVNSVKARNFILCGTLGGLAGIIDAFRIGSIDPLAGGSQIMFAAIAAAVIGGTLLTGGSGTIVGAFLGALVLGILKDGFTLSGVSAFTFDMILGAAILATMTVNVRLMRLRDQGRG
jgi:simple sugar transport system permease protein